MSTTATQAVKLIGIDHRTECSAQIRNVSSQAIKLFCGAWFKTGDLVAVELAHGFKEIGRIVYCRRQSLGYDVVVGLNPSDEVRRETRYRVSEAVRIAELGTVPSAKLQATVVNVSKSGFGLLTRHPLTIGCLVSVIFPDVIIIAEVRHCAADEQDHKSFRVGLSIERETPRSEGVPDLDIATGVERSWLSRVRACLSL